MTVDNFTINGVAIATPQGLTVTTKVEKQTVVLLNGKRRSRVKKVTRVVDLAYSMIKDEKVQVILGQTLKKSIENGITEVEIKYLNEFGEMYEITAEFDDISFSLTADSLMNDRWANISTIRFTEV